MPTDGNEGATPDEEEVILDVNTKRFSKKDHIFMSFFSKYGKNFIEKKRSEDPNNKNKTPDTAVQAEDEKLQKDHSVEQSMIKERPVYNKADFKKTYQTKNAKTARQPSPLARLFSVAQQGIAKQ